jgi:hypothetical protein
MIEFGWGCSLVGPENSISRSKRGINQGQVQTHENKKHTLMDDILNTTIATDLFKRKDLAKK